MRAHRLALLALVAGAAALAGCDQARTVTGESATPVTACTGCHGGLDNATGAPPRDTAGGSTGVKVGAHTAHVLAGLDCDACHVKPGRVREPGHLDGKVGITFGALAQLPEGSAAPAYDTTLHTCSNVYCHGAKLPTYAQGQATAPGWATSPLPGAPCASCHGNAATFGAPPAPHPGGMAGQEDCNVCHADTVDGTGALISAAAGGLHINGQKDISASACNACHGDRAGTRGETAGSAALFAPPVDSVGASTGAKVGAHLRHVSTVTALGSRLSQPFPCTECHVVPLTSGPHVQPPAQVVQFGTAAPPARNLSTAGGSLPVFTPGAGAAGGSCATTYCHGGGLGAGGTAHSPSWNAPGTAACGTCHFQASSVASAAGHPQEDQAGDPITTNAQCNQCHAGTVDPAGNVLVGLGNHVNGSIEAASPHPAGWVAAASHGPAAKRDLASCQPCHGTTFGTLVGAPPRSCNTCHASPATFVPGYTGPTHPTWQTECTFCHGDTNRAAVAGQDSVGTPTVNAGKVAPPVDSEEHTAATDVAVGAHLRHVSSNLLSAPFKCDQCHGVGVLAGTPHQGVGHVDTSVSIGWQLAATGTTPVITPPTTPAVIPPPTAGTIPAARTTTGAARIPAVVTCANYCHGSTMSGGTATTVSWNAPGPVGCGACHSLPPGYAAPSWHTAGANAGNCASCHPYVTPTSAANRALHVDGTVQLNAAISCTSCHGTAGVNAAPPGAASANVPATDARVGAHQKHVTGTALRAGALSCGDCHNPLPLAMNHADGSVTLAWNTLATTGPVTPTPAGDRPPGSTSTCANYCHGGKWAANATYRGNLTSPSWTGTTPATACDACHQAPPASAGHSSVTTATSCGSCHSGYTCTSGNLAACTVNKTIHLNGFANVLSLACSSCHGAAGRTAIAGTFGPAQSANNLIGMPPIDTAAASSGVKVGGHVSHSTPTPATQVITAVLCSECHGNAVNGYASTHSNSVSDVTFANATRANLGTGYTPGIAQGTGTTPDTCTTYCHGASLTAQQRGSITTWTWTSTTNANCGSCHGSAPNDPVHTSVSKSALATACNACHATVVNAAGGIIFNGTGTSATTLHINGARQTSATCRSCHGNATNFAPPTATNGTTATTTPKVGAHQKHLTGTTLRTGALDCNNCHTVPTLQNHATGAVNVAWNTLASVGFTPTPAAGAVAAGWETAPTCTNYCHGGKWAADASYRGATTSVSWTGTPADAACNDCHQAPPASAGHSSVTTATSCSTCHSGYTCTSGNLAACTVNRTIHLNGTFEAPAGGDCTGCHASAQGARRAIVSEFAGAWSHKRSATPAGTVTKFDCVVCHMEGTLTTGDVDSAYHLGVAGGPINLRDPDTGLHIKTVTWGGTNAGAYTSSTTDATFVQFSRNLSSNVLEAPVTAIMINQCLKCHDANGAQVGYVRGPTAGSSAKPFNTTIAGATYTGAGVTAGGVLGGVIDVAASFATANSSYHPISGKQNNSYVSALRMNAPWNVLTKTGGNTTSWGYLISCWDCHAPLNATGVQTATITAHGGTRTTRRDYWITNATNLCTACHQVVPATGATNNSHGAGSAFSGGGNSGPGGIARTACWRCHGSTASAKPSRPYSSQDVHGFNALSPALGTDTLWPVGATNTYRPFGFMRSAGTSGTWLTTSWKPLSGPSVPTGSATCGGTATLGGASCSSRNHGAYTPGGVY